MHPIARLLAADEAPRPLRGPTGFALLDHDPGGFPRIGLWLVVGAPRQGVSTLLGQWAGHLARQGAEVLVLGPYVDPCATARRIAAAQPSCSDWGEVPLALQRASSLPPVAAAGLPEVLVVDRPDAMTGADPADLAAHARAGRLVLVGLPREAVVQGPRLDSDLARAWTDTADLVVEIRLRGAAAGEEPLPLGVCRLDVLHNRHGCLGASTLTCAPRAERFDDASF